MARLREKMTLEAKNTQLEIDLAQAKAKLKPDPEPEESLWRVSLIEETLPDQNNEIQLTAAIQRLIDEKCDVYAIELHRNERRIEVGTPESYWIALHSFSHLMKCF